jgi:Flp pilus assembly protein TadB
MEPTTRVSVYEREEVEPAARVTADGRSLGELFSELWQDSRTLISQELELARTEMSQKASTMGSGAATAAAGGFIAYAGFLAIIAAIILVLALVIPVWLSALIVGVVVTLIGYLVLRGGLNKIKSENLAPEQTIDSLKNTGQWAKEQVR